MDTAKAKGLLTNKVGPLPAIAWAGIVGGIFIVFSYAKHRKAGPAAAATAVPVVQAQPDLGSASNFSNGYNDASNGGTSASGSGSGSTATQTYVEPAAATNQSWAARAINYLVGNGANPVDANSAIGNYVYGTGVPLNSTQTALLTQGLGHFGPPPEGVILPPVTTPITSTPAVPVSADIHSYDTTPIADNHNYYTGVGPDGYQYNNGTRGDRVNTSGYDPYSAAPIAADHVFNPMPY
jgi:hypothetical protein